MTTMQTFIQNARDTLANTESRIDAAQGKIDAFRAKADLPGYELTDSGTASVLSLAAEVKRLRSQQLEQVRQLATLEADKKNDDDYNASRSMTDAESDAMARENARRLGLLPALPASPAGRTPAQWVRSDDMRPAAVARGQRFADHAVAADHAAAYSQQEQAVIGQHGGIGNLIRAMTTTSGSALVPTVWAGDIIDRARNIAAVTKAGAQFIPMDAKVVQIGRLTTDPDASFIRLRDPNRRSYPNH